VGDPIERDSNLILEDVKDGKKHINTIHMIRVYVKGRKDAKAVKHALNVEVVNIGDKFDSIDYDKIPIFMFGREDLKLIEKLEDTVSTNLYSVAIINKKRVRNARLEEIRNAFEIAKAKIRLGFRFDSVFIFSPKNELGIEIHPDYDCYFVIGKEFEKNLEEIGVNVYEGSLVLRKLYGEEYYYSPNLVGIVYKKIGERIRVKSLGIGRRFDIDKTVKENEKVLKELEKISINFLKRFNFEEVYVPVSGGKDSTATLILAKKCFKDVKAIYVKTNYDAPFTDEYIDYIERKLNVEVIEEVVHFDVKKYGIPTHENRWCTAIKMKAIKKYGGLRIVGDRDAESRTRRLRPEIYGNEVFPIKYWSGAMVQLYILMNGLKLHPLYYKGFYRIGCTICPSLSDWEKKLLTKSLI